MASFDYSLHYRRFHDDSDQHAEEMARGMEALLVPHLPYNKAAKVLDVGCGYGFALRALSNLGFTNILGLEISPQQAARCLAAGLSVEVVEDSVSWLKLHPQTFELILLMDVLEHIPVSQQIEFSAAIYHSLKPLGRVLVQVPNANSPLAARWRHIDFTHYSSFTEHSLDFVLRNAGFRDIRIDSSKGIGRIPRRFWLKANHPGIRRILVRWCWLQVFKAELPWENIEDISFDLNLTAVATKCA